MRIGRMKYGLVVAALMALAACKPKIIVVDGLLSDPGNTPECPHSWKLRSGTISFLPGERIDVPEFHDCQRLRDSSDQYGALAAVFAKDSLEFVADSTLAKEGGRALALVYLPPANALPGGGASGSTYAPLGLTKPFACVIVRRGSNPAAWIRAVDDGRACSGPGVLTNLPTAGSMDLRVLPPPTGLSAADIPPVARWEWDETTRTQYIGVRCGSAWCEIGVNGFQSSAGHDPGAGSPGRADYALRGAYDEQRLAEFPGNVLTPAMNLGTVVPTAKLRGFNSSPPPNGTWVPVARTYLSPAAGTYDKKFNFAPTATVSPAEAAASTIFLCVSSTLTPCTAPDAQLDVKKCTADRTGARWISRVDRPTRGSRYFCVMYREHPHGFSVPPVVRWRWRADDETIWISCPSGCCEVKART